MARTLKYRQFNVKAVMVDKSESASLVSYIKLIIKDNKKNKRTTYHCYDLPYVASDNDILFGLYCWMEEQNDNYYLEAYKDIEKILRAHQYMEPEAVGNYAVMALLERW